jgi:hypothetical protein
MVRLSGLALLLLLLLHQPEAPARDGVSLASASGLSAGVLPDDPKKPASKEPEAPLHTLAAQGTAVPRAALAWPLLPDPEDLQPGNAALLWLRAGQEYRGARYKWTEKEWNWNSLPLSELPRKEVRAVLEKHAAALRLAEQAAHRKTCQWDWPPLTVQNIASNLPLEEIQHCREIASLLQLRCRLELSERQFDKAIVTLQTGFALARDLGKGDLMIQDLVGIAIETIFLGLVELWMQTPDSPNLYWSLTALPRPLVPVAHSIRTELNTFYRSFPALRDVKKPLSAAQMRLVSEQLLDSMSQLSGEEMPAWMRSLARTVPTLRYYDEAKKTLLDRGRSAKAIEAMPHAQVVLLAWVEEYDEIRDEISKWLSVPTWQGREPFEKLMKTASTDPRYKNLFFLGQLAPAISKVFVASLRTERVVAAMRGAEALRMHVAGHGGKPPARWSDITAVPLPIDPVTGRGLDDFYRVEKGRAFLEVPPPPGMPAIVARRYQWIVPKGEEKSPPK